MTLLLSIVIDVTVVCLVALSAVALLRRQSAALRHAVLAVAFVILALVPVLEIVLPTLPLVEWQTQAPVATSAVAVVSESIVGAAMPPAEVAPVLTFSWRGVLFTVWVVGVVVILGRLALGFAQLARLEKLASVGEQGRWRELADETALALALRRRITILRSPDPTLLVTYGIRRPRLLVPVDAERWPDEHVRMVLTHELVHVRRHDPATLMLAEIICALHWCNPLVWLCASRLRRESECACDDAVLNRGTDATRYATLLLNLARMTAARHRAWVTAPAIAQPSTLEGRIAAMLNRQRNRAPVTRLAKTLVVIIAGVFVVPLVAAGIAPPTLEPLAVANVNDVILPAAPLLATDPEPQQPQTAALGAVPARGTARVTPPAANINPFELTRQNEANRTAGAAVIPTETLANAAAQAPTNFTGTVIDASGGVVPGVSVRLADPALGLEARTVSDGNGRFLFRDVTPGRYELALSIAGFATVNSALQIDAGTTVTRVVTLPLGTVEESINVLCSRAGLVPSMGGRLARWGARAFDAIVPTLSAQDAAPRRPVRVGGNIRAALKVTDVRPVCPTTLVPATGATVRLVGRIGTDGLLHEVRRVETVAEVELPAALADSALDAVRQWVFTPTLLNGQPVDTTLSIRISYR